MGSQGGENSSQGSSWRTRWLWQRLAVPPLHADKPGETNGEQDRPRKLGSSMGKESLKTSGSKNLWGLWQWEKLQASQESSLERLTGTQNVHRLTQKSAPEGPNLLVDSRGSH